MQEAVARTQRMCAVMLDTKGPFEVTVKRDPATPRPRSGGPDASPDDDVAGGPAPLNISADQTVVLAGDDDAEWEASHPSVLPLSDAGFLACLAPGDLVQVARYLASGMERASLFLEVQEVTHARAVCRALTPAVLGGLVTVTRAAPAPDCATKAAAAEEREAPPPLSCLCDEDREWLTAFARHAVDFVALSHCESGAQVAEARAFLRSIGMRETRVLAKVETRAALRDFEAILAEADGVIVSRGNLGLAGASRFTFHARTPQHRADVRARQCRLRRWRGCRKKLCGAATSPASWPS